VSAATPEELWEELAVMTRDAQQSGEEVQGLRTQLANALILAARVAPYAPQTLEDRGQKFPDSLNISSSDRTQLRGWIAQLWLVIRHKHASLPEKTVEDAIWIQPPEGGNLVPELATFLGGRNYRAGRPTCFCITPGSIFWRLQLRTHHQRKDERNSANVRRVFSILF